MNKWVVIPYFWVQCTNKCEKRIEQLFHIVNLKIVLRVKQPYSVANKVAAQCTYI